jgi:hypothetical protein
MVARDCQPRHLLTALYVLIDDHVFPRSATGGPAPRSTRRTVPVERRR